jgi:hypothetical protein
MWYGPLRSKRIWLQGNGQGEIRTKPWGRGIQLVLRNLACHDVAKIFSPWTSLGGMFGRGLLVDSKI